MKKLNLAGIVVGAALLALAGCSGTGTIEIWNQTTGDLIVSIDGYAQNLTPGGYLRQPYNLDYVSFIYEESRDVAVDLLGKYKLPESRVETVDVGDEISLDVYGDAGAVAFTNDSDFNISEFYVSPSDESSWGDNWAADGIGAGEWIYVPVAPGVPFDVKVVDDYWGTYEIYYYDFYGTVDEYPVAEVGRDWGLWTDGTGYIYWYTYLDSVTEPPQANPNAGRAGAVVAPHGSLKSR